jgi:hypothetical protein
MKGMPAATEFARFHVQDLTEFPLVFPAFAHPDDLPVLNSVDGIGMDLEVGGFLADGRDLEFRNRGAMIIEGQVGDGDILTAIHTEMHHLAATDQTRSRAGKVDVFGSIEENRDRLVPLRVGIGIGNMILPPFELIGKYVIPSGCKMNVDWLLLRPGTLDDQALIK